jgi:dCMP deaminase
LSQTDWDLSFLEECRLKAGRSKDPSTKVGTLIADPKNRVVSSGFNGFPRGIADDDRLNNREIKYRIMVHGEMNSILFARCDLTGCTLYCWPFSCCDRCAPHVIQAGIVRVVAPVCLDPRWEESLQFAYGLFGEAGVKVDLYSFH